MASPIDIAESDDAIQRLKQRQAAPLQHRVLRLTPQFLPALPCPALPSHPNNLQGLKQTLVHPTIP